MASKTEGVAKVAAFGTIDPGQGLSVAYKTHSEALSVFTELESFQVHHQQPIEGKNAVYVHALPAQTQHVLANHQHLFNSSHRRIAYWVCESSELPRPFKQFAPLFDEIWTASTFCASTLAQLNLRVKVVPHCVHHLKFSPPAPEPFTFLFMFDGGSRVTRKNPFFLIEAFVKAFGERKDVRLIVKAKNLGSALFNHMVRLGGASNIVFLDQSLKLSELFALYERTHVYASLHCAEGFGLTLLEAMGHGIPVVATAYSGNTDFMTQENSRHVAYSLTPCNDDYYLGEWAKPNLDSAVDCLRYYPSNPSAWLEARNHAFRTALDWGYHNTIERTWQAFTL